MLTRHRRTSVGLMMLLLASCATRSPVSVPPTTEARVGSVTLNLKPTTVVRPTLPEAARAQGVMGPVLVEVRISETGDVSVLSVVRGHPLLNDVAKAAVGQWKYPPTIVEGRAVPVIAIATVTFAGDARLRPAEASRWAASGVQTTR